ncbi:dirigent protein 22-like protein [Cinnamomum micranthum f. kanehirae]|uniref:Dirigent protein n=1 Tax=Cinnamomum micranthum f. kanehirae TaxID=337451 RepID=A0A443NSG8_9MAGN|nr:dirigent protein 22-like protein [Cinnamomum micranthum f. kanehirae]
MKETNMVFYLHDLFISKNATAVPVAKRSKEATVTDFGTLMVIDDAVTEGPKKTSAQVGRAQGIYVNSALDGSSMHLAFSIIFTNSTYNGSTLEIQGADRYLLNRREVSIVSGTGAFRLAKGYAVLETVYFSSSSNGVIKIIVTVYHY